MQWQCDDSFDSSATRLAHLSQISACPQGTSEKRWRGATRHTVPRNSRLGLPHLQPLHTLSPLTLSLLSPDYVLILVLAADAAASRGCKSSVIHWHSSGRLLCSIKHVCYATGVRTNDGGDRGTNDGHDGPQSWRACFGRSCVVHLCCLVPSWQVSDVRLAIFSAPM